MSESVLPQNPSIPQVDRGPSGIGGWLILPILGLVVTPPLVIYYLATDFVPVLKPEAWALLASPSSKYYHPLFVPLIVFEVACNIALAVAACVGLWLAKGNSRKFPKLMIGFLLFNIVFLLIDEIVGGIYQKAIGVEEDSETLKQLGRAIVSAGIWIPYFIFSKRVKNTFVN